VSPIIDVVAPRLLAPAVMLAAALIVKGYTDVGEGFSAGVIVALAVGLRYVALGRRRADSTLRIARRADAVAAAGLLIALGFGFAGVAAGEPPFTHLPPPGEPVVHVGSLELTTAVGFDIGLFLLVSGSLVVLIRHLTGLLDDGELATWVDGERQADGEFGRDAELGTDGELGRDAALGTDARP
jgi:multisubunit Na+/H+ antiporter MnhB subunit